MPRSLARMAIWPGARSAHSAARSASVDGRARSALDPPSAPMLTLTPRQTSPARLARRVAAQRATVLVAALVTSRLPAGRVPRGTLPPSPRNSSRMRRRDFPLGCHGESDAVQVHACWKVALSTASACRNASSSERNAAMCRSARITFRRAFDKATGRALLCAASDITTRESEDRTLPTPGSRAPPNVGCGAPSRRSQRTCEVGFVELEDHRALGGRSPDHRWLAASGTRAR
jgi:hypothetical protein